jgi:hypothetical protein
MKYALAVSLRRPEERFAARQTADSILRADRRRQRRMAANDDFGGGAAPASVKTKREDGPFAALRNHPLYGAADRRISSSMTGENHGVQLSQQRGCTHHRCR